MKTPYHHELLLRRWAQRHNFDIGNVVHRMREQYKFYDRQSRIMPLSLNGFTKTPGLKLRRCGEGLLFTLVMATKGYGYQGVM